MSGVVSLGGVQIASGSFVSGYSPSGVPLMSGAVTSGHLASGSLSPGRPGPSHFSGVAGAPAFPQFVACGSVYREPCVKCGADLTYGSEWAHKVTVQLTSPVIAYSGAWPSTYAQNVCPRCAGYVSGVGFETREDWIRDTVGLPPDTPPGIVADWLRDHSRYKDADYMLSIHEQLGRMSGG